MLPPLLLVSLSASVLSAILFSYTKWKKSKDRFPSPPSDFFLGHLRILNQNTSCITLADYGKKYGKSRIVYIYEEFLYFPEKAIYYNFMLPISRLLYSTKRRMRISSWTKEALITLIDHELSYRGRCKRHHLLPKEAASHQHDLTNE